MTHQNVLGVNVTSLNIAANSFFHERRTSTYNSSLLDTRCKTAHFVWWQVLKFFESYPKSGDSFLFVHIFPVKIPLCNSIVMRTPLIMQLYLVLGRVSSSANITYQENILLNLNHLEERYSQLSGSTSI